MSALLRVSQATKRTRATWSSDESEEGAWERSADEFAFQMSEGDEDDGRWDDEPDWEDDDWEWDAEEDDESQ